MMRPTPHPRTLSQPSRAGRQPGEVVLGAGEATGLLWSLGKGETSGSHLDCG